MAKRNSEDEGEIILEMLGNDLLELDQLAENDSKATNKRLEVDHEGPGRFFCCGR